MRNSYQNVTRCFEKKLEIMVFETARKLQNLSLLRTKSSKEAIIDCRDLFNFCIVVKTLIQTPTRCKVLNAESDTLFAQSLTRSKIFTSKSDAWLVIIIKIWSFVKNFFRNLTYCRIFYSKSDTLQKNLSRVGDDVNFLFIKLTRCRRVLPKRDRLCIFQFKFRDL